MSSENFKIWQVMVGYLLLWWWWWWWRIYPSRLLNFGWQKRIRFSLSAIRWWMLQCYQQCHASWETISNFLPRRIHFIFNISSALLMCPYSFIFFFQIQNVHDIFICWLNWQNVQSQTILFQKKLIEFTFLSVYIKCNLKWLYLLHVRHAYIDMFERDRNLENIMLSPSEICGNFSMVIFFWNLHFKLFSNEKKTKLWINSEYIQMSINARIC